MMSDSRLNLVHNRPTDVRHSAEPQDAGTAPPSIHVVAKTPAPPFPYFYPLLLTEDELVDLLRIPDIGTRADHHNVIENLRRMHGLPCIHICKAPLYPFEAVRQWILDKAEKERR